MNRFQNQKELPYRHLFMGNHIQIKNVFMQQNAASRSGANLIWLVQIAAVTKMGQGGLQPKYWNARSWELRTNILLDISTLCVPYHACLHFLT